MDKKEIEHIAVSKLILLYFILKNNLMASSSQIAEFIIEHSYSDYFTLQNNLSDLSEQKYLQKRQKMNRTIYEITQDGQNTLSLFLYLVPEGIKYNVNKYISENKGRLRSEFESGANYFHLSGDEYLVKCALHDINGNILMEISLVAPSKSDAQLICKNWKGKTGSIYEKIIAILME